MGLSDVQIDPLDRPSLPSFLTEPKREKLGAGARLRAALGGLLPKRAAKPAAAQKITDPHRLLTGPSVAPVAPPPPAAPIEPQLKARLISPNQPVTSPSRKGPPPIAATPKEPGRALIVIPNPPKRRPPNRWLKPTLWGLGAATAVGIIGALGVTIALHPTTPVRTADGDSLARPGFFAQVGAGFGLRVQDVLVEGRVRSGTETILSSLQTRRGEAILAFDAEAARQRLEALPWIESAIVERRLPDTVYARLQERSPYALWQNGGRFHLVDSKGVIILTDPGAEFAQLPVIVGEGAPQRAEEILLLLEGEPELKPLVTAAVRVGDRRWNLHLASGIDVRLPEENPAVALGVLADLHRQQKLLDRDIVAVDLRQSDRMIVQLSPAAAAAAAAAQKQAAPKAAGGGNG